MGSFKPRRETSFPARDVNSDDEKSWLNLVRHLTDCDSFHALIIIFAIDSEVMWLSLSIQPDKMGFDLLKSNYLH